MSAAATSVVARPLVRSTDGVMNAMSTSGRAGKGARRALVLEDANDETLLATRLCDLPVQLEGTLMARRVKRLHRELEARNIVALPHVWLSEEFFNPDGVLGFAIPFYLAHPRLMRLERSQMLEVEGAGEAESRRIFRHEAGHAIDEAYGFHNRERYRLLFGDPTAPYPDVLQATPREPGLCHQPRQLVRPSAPGRGLRRDFRNLAQSVTSIGAATTSAGRHWKSSNMSMN